MMSNKYHIFSIESRKGGVGKTTMALNLSMMLLKQRYKVLFIDCDISGTPIPETTVHSPYWGRFVNLMKETDGTLSNLLSIYKDYYQIGEIDGKSIVGKLNYNQKKIHVIASDIYAKVEGRAKLIIDPRQLMDEKNSYWLLSMIKEISQAFADLDDTDTAIIIDNSPGYVGLGKGIRDWITSKGPRYAHFLLVASLDEQDVMAIASSASEISYLMHTKWEIAHPTNNIERMKELQHLIIMDSSFGQFYNSLSSTNPYPSAAMLEPSIDQYVCIVFNKVPSSIKDDFAEYVQPQNLRLLFPVIAAKLIGEGQDGFPDNIVFYDSMISEQFIPLRPIGSEKGEKFGDWNERFNTRYRQADKWELNDDKVIAARMLTRSYKSLMKALHKAKYVGLSKTFKPVVSPSAFSNDIYAQLKNLVGYQLNGELAFFPRQIEEDAVFRSNQQWLEEFVNDKGISYESSVLYSLLKDLHGKLSVKQGRNIMVIVNFSIMFKMYLLVQRQRYLEEVSYHDFLMKEFADRERGERNWRMYLKGDYIPICKGLNVEYIWFEPMLKKNFLKFYRSMCYALLRLEDAVSDFRLTIQAFQKTLESKSPRIMNKPLEEYVKDVVIRKKSNFSIGKFKEVSSMPFEMQEIQELIKNKVLAKWLL